MFVYTFCGFWAVAILYPVTSILPETEQKFHISHLLGFFSSVLSKSMSWTQRKHDSKKKMNTQQKNFFYWSEPNNNYWNIDCTIKVFYASNIEIIKIN